MKNVLLILFLFLVTFLFGQRELVHTVHFNNDRANITSSELKSLEGYMYILELNQILEISLSGHTDANIYRKYMVKAEHFDLEEIN